MRVIDHEPALWFLFEGNASLFLHVNCNHGPAGYGVLVELTAEEKAAHSQKGHAYVNKLAEAVQNSGPGNGYQLRDVSSQYSAEIEDAVNNWRASLK